MLGRGNGGTRQLQRGVEEGGQAHYLAIIIPPLVQRLACSRCPAHIPSHPALLGKDNRIGLENLMLNFFSITFKLGCCGSKIYVADSFNHNKNITFKFASAAATLVTDQV